MEYAEIITTIQSATARPIAHNINDNGKIHFTDRVHRFSSQQQTYQSLANQEIVPYPRLIRENTDAME